MTDSAVLKYSIFARMCFLFKMYCSRQFSAGFVNDFYSSTFQLLNRSTHSSSPFRSEAQDPAECPVPFESVETHVPDSLGKVMVARS